MLNSPKSTDLVGMDHQGLLDLKITEGQYKVMLMLGSAINELGVVSISREQFDKYPIAAVRGTYEQFMEVVNELIAKGLMWRVADDLVQVDSYYVTAWKY